MMSNINCEFEAIKVGQAMKMIFQSTDEGPPVPIFEPVGVMACAT